jgi:hypothetical protein
MLLLVGYIENMRRSLACLVAVISLLALPQNAFSADWSSSALWQLRSTLGPIESMTPQGKVNNDSLEDVAYSIPSADTMGRTDNGIVYLAYGRVTYSLNHELTALGHMYEIHGPSNNSAIRAVEGYTDDLNMDGYADVMVYSHTLGTIWVLPGAANFGHWDLSVSAALATITGPVGMGSGGIIKCTDGSYRLGGDGILWHLSAITSGPVVPTATETGTGVVSPRACESGAFTHDTGPLEMIQGDYNGDGTHEWAKLYPDRLELHTSPMVIMPMTTSYTGMSAGDYDDDGMEDIFLYNGLTTRVIYGQPRWDGSNLSVDEDMTGIVYLRSANIDGQPGDELVIATASAFPAFSAYVRWYPERLPLQWSEATIASEGVTVSILTCSSGTWTGADTYSYTWYLGTREVGAGASYVAKDPGEYTCEVDAKNESGTSTARTSFNVAAQEEPVVINDPPPVQDDNEEVVGQEPASQGPEDDSNNNLLPQTGIFSIWFAHFGLLLIYLGTVSWRRSNWR